MKIDGGGGFVRNTGLRWMSLLNVYTSCSMKLSELLVKAMKRARELGQDTCEACQWKQRVSFAYGNAAISNPRVTREMVEQAAGPQPEHTCESP